MVPYFILAAFLAGAIGSWTVQNWRHDALEKDRIEQAREDRARQEKTVDAAAVGHEADKVRIETEFVVITEKVRDAIKGDFYSDGQLCFDASGMQLIEQATGAASATGLTEAAVPRDRPAD